MMTKLLRWLLPFKDIGWTEMDEEFTRFTLAKTLWFNVYLHRLHAPRVHERCHDHPWSFVTLLFSGYWEYSNESDDKYSTLDGMWRWRRRGSVLYRPATYRHTVVTEGVSWSLVATSAKWREWGFVDSCQVPHV